MVDNCWPCVQRCSCNFRFRCVNGEGNFGSAREGFDYRYNAVDLFLKRNRLAARPRRFTANVDDIDAFGNHLFSLGQRGVEGGELSAVAEAIRRDIKNAHDERALTDGHSVVLNLPKLPSHRLGWRRIAAGDGWQNRVSGLCGRLLQLRAILAVTGID